MVKDSILPVQVIALHKLQNPLRKDVSCKTHSCTFSKRYKDKREDVPIMDGRPRSIHVTSLQKRKLAQLIAKNPQLIACKVTQNFNYKDSHRLWQSIANDCNSLPGAKKTWRQWRKTFQDLRAKAKKQQKEMNGEIPVSAIMFSPDERIVLGFKNVAEHSGAQPSEDSNLMPLVQEDIIIQENFPTADTEMESNDHQETISEPKSPPEVKVFSRRSERKVLPKLKRTYKRRTNDCYLNCDLLATQEQEKIRIKEDYLNFKKEYLRQKLKLMKEQTEALKSIAKELSK